MRKANAATLDADTHKLSNVGAGGGETANITLTDSSTLGQLIDTLSMDLLGEKLDDGVKAGLITKLQSQQRDYGVSQATTQFNQSTAAATGGASSELDSFMNALIGQESGGDPNAQNGRTNAMGLGQILPDNWGPWAAEAGVNPGDFSEKNQRAVIRYKLAQYYASYGNWRDVAIAWYSGQPGSAWSAATLARPQGAGNEPSMNEYADSVLGRMQAFTGSQLQAGATPGLSFNVTESLPDDRTRIESELKALDPAAWHPA
mgnify:CR=1 FL=1